VDVDFVTMLLFEDLTAFESM